MPVRSLLESLSTEAPKAQDTQGLKMLGVIEEWREDHTHVDNTSRYLFLLLFKFGLDTTILYICWNRVHTFFLNVCGLSIVLADAVMFFALTTVWFLNPLKSPVSVCFLLAHFSSVFSMLPLPMVGLGLLDYLFHDKCLANQRPVIMKLTNTAMTLLVWLVAAVYSYETTRSSLREIEHFGGLKALVCEVQESGTVNVVVISLLIVTICALLPHYTSISAWYRRANMLSNQRDKAPHIQKSDLLRNAVGQDAQEDAAAKALVETTHQPPSLCVSFMLGFASVWLPYLFISVIFVLLGLGIPAYILVNLLWMECTNSFLVGVVFWLKCAESGQYNHLPDNICIWRTYLHLSRGTPVCQENFNTTKWNPSEGPTNTVSHQIDQVV
ncbi:unnamed protein product [Boreogadus saida]